MEGKIRSVSKGIAKLDLANGATVPCNIELLVEADRNYIEDWFITEKIIGREFFEFSLDRSKETVGRSSDVSTNTTVRDATYTVKIRSRVSIDLHNVEIQYKIFKKQDDMFSDARRGRFFEEGSHKEEVWSALEEISFDTISMTLEEEQLKANWIAVGGKARSKDRLGGIWIRIFKGDKMLAEYASPAFLMEKYDWYDPSSGG